MGVPPNTALGEFKEALAASDVTVGIATLRRFLDRHEITLKNDGARCRAGPAGRPEAAPGLVQGTARPRPRASGVHRWSSPRGDRRASIKMARTRGYAARSSRLRTAFLMRTVVACPLRSGLR